MSDPHTILVVEDGQSQREALARMLRLERYHVLVAEDAQQALRHLDDPVDLVISDLRMGEASGLDLLRYWEQRHPGTPFILVTAYGDVDSAVNAMKLGASEFFTKPFRAERLLSAVARCLDLPDRPGTASQHAIAARRASGQATRLEAGGGSRTTDSQPRR